MSDSKNNSDGASAARKSNLKFNAIFVGADPLLKECAQLWLDAGHAVKLVVSDHASVSAWCDEQGIECLNDVTILADSGHTGFDYLFSIINFRKIDGEILERASRAAINFHDGPLPQYAGLNVTTWALLNGESHHAICWHNMTSEIDAGAIYLQESIDIERHETSYSLNLKCYSAALTSFPKLIDILESGAEPVPQATDCPRTVYRSSARPSGLLRFDDSAANVVRVVNALDFGHWENPVATAKIANGPEWLSLTYATETVAAAEAPGTVVAVDDGSLVVATADGAVALSGFLRDSGVPISAREAAKLLGASPGVRLRPDARFECDDDGLQNSSGVESYWTSRLSDLEPCNLPLFKRHSSTIDRAIVTLPHASAEDSRIADYRRYWSTLWILYLMRLSGQSRLDVRCALSESRSPWLENAPPARFTISPDWGFAQSYEQLGAQLRDHATRGTFIRDLLHRHPAWAENYGMLGHFALSTSGDTVPEVAICLCVDADVRECSLVADESRVVTHDLQTISESFRQFCENVHDAPSIHATDVCQPDDYSVASIARNKIEFGEDALRPLDALILHRFAAAPAAPAIYFQGTTLSYGEVSDRAQRLAAHLRELRVGADSVVGIYLDRSPDLIIAMLAVLLAGGAYLPMDPFFPEHRLQHMLTDSGSRIIISSPDMGRRMDFAKRTIVDIEESQGIRPEDADIAAGRRLSDLSYVMYTSGSTGAPKGVEVTDRSVVNFLQSMLHSPGLSANDRFLAVTTASFDISILEIFGPLVAGACIVLASSEEAADGTALNQLLNESGASIMQATPATWSLMIESGWAGSTDLKILCGGEPLNSGLAQELCLRSDEVWNMYGPTECTVWSSHKKINKNDPTVTIGTPIAATDILILNGSLKLQPKGIPGELFIGGAGLARGYRNRHEMTAERFVQVSHLPVPGGKLYRTGDLAVQLPDGEFKHLGRLDNQIKFRGYRIEPGEIEYHLNQFDGVSDSVVIISISSSGEENLVAYLLCPNGNAPSNIEIRKSLRRNLPNYMIPRFFVRLQAFPLTSNGKLDRASLPSPKPQEENADYVALQTHVEKDIAAIWTTLLQVGRISRDANFFAIGGDSLLAVKATKAMNDRFSGIVELKWLVHEDLQSIGRFCQKAHA